MATVVSVNISEKKGTIKHPVPEIQLKFRHGIVGDAHAGDWHRQISLLAEESVDTMRAACPIPLEAGVFAEAPISSMGWTAPISLLAAIMEIRMVSLRRAVFTSAGFTLPFPSTGR